MNCTAHVQAERCDVWAPTQGQTATHGAAVAASGLSPDQVFVHPTYMGGGFGRRGEVDFVTDAVDTSKAVGRPVKVVWSREDDMRHDYYRPYTYVRMWAALDADGTPVAWKQRLVQPSLLERNRPGALAGTRGIDFISVDSAANLPYDIPNVRVEYTEFDPGIPFGGGGEARLVDATPRGAGARHRHSSSVSEPSSSSRRRSPLTAALKSEITIHKRPGGAVELPRLSDGAHERGARDRGAQRIEHREPRWRR